MSRSDVAGTSADLHENHRKPMLETKRPSTDRAVEGLFVSLSISALSDQHHSIRLFQGYDIIAAVPMP